VVKHIRDKSLPVTNIYTSTYFSNVFKFHQITPNPETGGFLLAMRLPDDSRINYFDVDQMGDWALAVLQEPSKYIGELPASCDGSALTPRPRKGHRRVRRVPLAGGDRGDTLPRGGEAC
jgi:hypothetical protein